MSAFPALNLPAFRPRLPWLGGDLQTLRNRLCRVRDGLNGGVELSLAMDDGEALIGLLHQAAPGRRRPLAVLIHGMAGSSDSAYVVSTARYLLALGFPVLRLNLRGAGASKRICRGRYHAGRSEDLAAALRGIPAEAAAGGLVLIGYSLGGNVMLKFLGEAAHGVAVSAAVSVSAPLDLALSADRISAPRNFLYHRYLLGALKAEALAPTALISAAEREGIVGARSIRDFDERFVAPRHGFAGAAEYYAKCSSRAFVDRIGVPCLVIHALDDPWIPAAAYAGIEWPALRAIRLEMLPGGGHLGFHGTGSQIPWHDRAIGELLRAVA